MSTDEPTRKGHHGPLPSGAGFDDDGVLVATADFDWETVDPPASDDRSPSEGRAEIVRRLLLYFAESADVLTAGRKVLLLAWLTGGLPDVRTQRELARLLELSPSRTSELLQAVLPVAFNSLHDR